MPFQPSRPAGHAPHGYTTLYFDLEHGVQLTSNILMLIGIVLVIKGYVALFKAQAGAETNPASGEGVEAGLGGGGSGENLTP